jgi:hypothetical protein
MVVIAYADICASIRVETLNLVKKLKYFGISRKLPNFLIHALGLSLG